MKKKHMHFNSNIPLTSYSNINSNNVYKMYGCNTLYNFKNSSGGVIDIFEIVYILLTTLIRKTVVLWNVNVNFDFK